MATAAGTAGRATGAGADAGAGAAAVEPDGGYPAELSRRLCAAVSTDRRLGRQLIEGVLNEGNRAIAVSPGTDLVTVARYALRANRHRLAADVMLFIILCAFLLGNLISGGLEAGSPGLTAVLRGAGLAVIALLAAAWAVIFSERFVRLFGRVARGLRPGVFEASGAPGAGRWPGSVARLRRVAASQAANVTVSSGEPPFPGYGPVVEGWSAAVDVTRAASSLPPRAFSAGEVHEHVATALAGLGLPGLRVSSRVFVTPAGSTDERLRGGLAGLQADEGTVRQLIDFPAEHARPYLAATVIGWHGDLTVTTLVRFVRSPGHLFVEVARTALGPLRAPAGTMDGLGRWPGLAGFTRLAGRSLVDVPWRLLASGPALAYRAVAPVRRARNRRRADRSCDYGARLSLREAVSAPDGKFFQDLDAQRYGQLIEQELLRALAAFLSGRNVDVPDLGPPGGRILRPWSDGPAQHGQLVRNGQARR